MLVYICDSIIYPRIIRTESETTPGREYTTLAATLFNEAVCDCPGWHFRETCKHVQNLVNCNHWEPYIEDKPITYDYCPKCHSPINLYETEPEDYSGK